MKSYSDFSVIMSRSEINIPSLKLSPCSPFFVILIDLAVVHIAKQHNFWSGSRRLKTNTALWWIIEIAT